MTVHRRTAWQGDGPQEQPEGAGEQPQTVSGGPGFMLCGSLPDLPLSGPQWTHQQHGSSTDSWISLTPLWGAEGSDRQGPEPGAVVAQMCPIHAHG